MTAVQTSSNWISPEEYLEGERCSEIRHEYVYCRVYARAGANDDHNRIAGNIFGELSTRLRRHRCEAFINDMKAKVLPTSDVYYYPDVMVVCDSADNAKYFRERPAVVVEVISPDTERTDRREKALAYRDIPSVQSYVIVEQDRIEMTILRRTEVGWKAEMLQGRNEILRLPEIGVNIPLERIYERTAAWITATSST